MRKVNTIQREKIARQLFKDAFQRIQEDFDYIVAYDMTESDVSLSILVQFRDKNAVVGSSMKSRR